jgi:hypothetical protein
MNQYFVIFRRQYVPLNGEALNEVNPPKEDFLKSFTPKNSLILIHIFQRLKIHFIYFSSLSDYFTTNGLVNMDKIIREYQTYAKRRGFRYFMYKDENGKITGLKEAALVYSFDTFIHSFLAVLKGKSYLEPHVALGR